MITGKLRFYLASYPNWLNKGRTLLDIYDKAFLQKQNSFRPLRNRRKKAPSQMFDWAFDFDQLDSTALNPNSL